MGKKHFDLNFYFVDTWACKTTCCELLYWCINIFYSWMNKWVHGPV